MQDKDIVPDFIARITLYPTAEGGRKGPIRGPYMYSCPCKFDPRDSSGWDMRILVGDDTIAPGETKEVGVVFLTRQIAPIFQERKFYLWEGGIIGEATAVKS